MMDTMLVLILLFIFSIISSILGYVSGFRARKDTYKDLKEIDMNAINYERSQITKEEYLKNKDSILRKYL